jgi:glycogen operon protein
VQECHVDGFRFDLAVALGRGRDDAYDPDHPFLMALRTDPVLSQVKLIAEPWDLGVHGWRTGQFPPPFAEWNDHFRDAVRTFWLPDVERSAQLEPGSGVRQLATRLAGSQDLFGAQNRGPTASINYVAAHDGFTLADTTIYAYTDNVPHATDGTESAAGDEAGDEARAANQDGGDAHDDHRSWTQLREGPGVNTPQMAGRRRSIRNMLATELLATGVPMINAGDEFGRSQQGNNNAYYQDNPVSWFDWELEPWQRDLLATTRFLTKLRATSPVLRQRSFFTGHLSHKNGIRDVQWLDPDGRPMENGTWDNPHTRTLTMLLDGSHVGGQSLLIVFHGGALDADVTLPEPGEGAGYRLVWDSTWDLPQETSEVVGAEPITITAASIRVYSLVP